mgnify:FL=1|tara:strand:+ start:28999 stop:31035 length:2037 start_codon:yes stop_codon:yes gene_type:complete
MGDRNLLSNETSPYLLQHQDNPVHWRPWGADALQAAKAEDKPILLSIGYAACHWCHVMAHESFEDPETADIMNNLFINIKVDREERPDLDAIYQSTLHLLGQQGGWPLTMFLTPDGEPFWGGTYFPDTPRYGMPSFRQLLNGVSSAYQRKSEDIVKNVGALRDGLAKMSAEAGAAGEDISLAGIDAAATSLLRAVDPVHGGLNGAPKFPQPCIFKFLWRSGLRTGNPDLKQAVIRTLDAMSQGGIYDHLGGGYARYSTDDEWLAPHFEKMLYDNAQLIDLLVDVWRETGSDLYETRIRECVAWLEREMITEGGAFSSTIDADSEGEEGKFYVWQEAEIDALLGEDSTVFKAAYDVGPHGNWEGKTILRRTKAPELNDHSQEAALAGMRAKLFAEREKRIRPDLDDKVLSDWNGMMIAALADAGATFGEPEWTNRAISAWSFVLQNMNDGNCLSHAHRLGRNSAPGILDDYAQMARAGIALFEATGDKACLDQAINWVDYANTHFLDKEQGGYFFTADNAEALITRTRTAMDNAVPAGNGVMMEVLARLWRLTGDVTWRHQAEHLFKTFTGDFSQRYISYPTLIGGYELLIDSVDLVILGRDEADIASFSRAVRQHPLPVATRLLLNSSDDLPDTHPAFGKAMVDNRTTLYICHGTVCSAPVTSLTEIASALNQEIRTH